MSSLYPFRLLKFQVMKTIFITGILILFSCGLYAQCDTIYTNDNKIVCNVKQITPDAVQYTYPGEEVIYSVYQNTIQKIVFKSGRVQTFATVLSLKPVNSVDDYNNVTVTNVESEVLGLFKLDFAGSKAKGTTEYSNMERVKERAYYKLRIVAALMGANIVYLTQVQTTGNQYGNSATSNETNLAGIAYTNVLPDYDGFNKSFGTRTTYQGNGMVSLWSDGSDMKKDFFDKTLSIQKIYNDNGLIMISGTIPGIKCELFRVTHFTNDSFTLFYQDKTTAYNLYFRL